MSKPRQKAGAKKNKAGPGRTWWLLGGLILLGVIAYWNSFSGPLVFDDLLTVQKNSGVRFGEFNWNLLSGRALLFVTFTLNYIWSGQEVWTYHLVNLLFHLVNGILLFFAADLTFQKLQTDGKLSRIYALGAAAFFVVHPLQTQSVTYISSRSELLSTFFYLAALLLFIWKSESGVGFLFSLIILAPFLLGMSAKETVISLPVVLVLYDFLFLSKGSWRPLLSRWRFYFTFLAGGIAVAWYVATVTLRGSIGTTPKGHLPIHEYFLTQLRVIVRYIYLVFLPIGQNLDYRFRTSVSPLENAVVASFVFLVALVVLGYYLRKRQPVFSFAILWFFLTLAPTSSVVPILDVIFEHRLYLPLAGVSFAFPVFVVLVSDRSRKWFSLSPSPAILGAILLAILTVATIRRNYIWQDEVRLFEDVLAKSPRNDRAFNSLAWAHYKKGEYDKAISVLHRALEVIPSQRRGFAETLGQLYLKTGRYDEAAKLFEEVLKLHTEPPLIALVYNNIGVSYLYKWQALESKKAQMTTGEYDSELRGLLNPASEAFRNAVNIEYSMFSAWDSYVYVNYLLGKGDEVEVQALATIATKEDFNAVYAVGKIAYSKATDKLVHNLGSYDADFARASEFFERAEKIKKDEKLLFFNHGYSLDVLKQQDKAIEKYLWSIRIDPLFIEAHHNLALIYMAQGRTREAIDHFAEVLRYDPNHRNTNLNLAKLYAGQGDKIAARNYLQTLLRQNTGDQQVVQLWQQLGL